MKQKNGGRESGIIEIPQKLKKNECGITTKKCSKCKRILSISSFHKQSSKKDGYCFMCKECKKCCPNYNLFDTLPKKFDRWKFNAKQRDLEFSISLKDIEHIPMVCYYTHGELTFEKNKPNTISIDRIDSEKGYVFGNVVFCRKDINKFKSNWPIEKFVSMCKEVVNAIG